MKKSKKKIEPAPEEFKTVMEASEFWDSHDASDYGGETKEAKFKTGIKDEKEVYSRALETARIDNKLKDKLNVLKKAYSEGYIKKESYQKGASRIKSAYSRGKRNIYK